jgi:hypothetical protein
VINRPAWAATGVQNASAATTAVVETASNDVFFFMGSSRLRTTEDRPVS